MVSYGGGGSTTIKDWLNCLPKENPPIPEGVLLNVFDNEQVIGRKRGLRPKNKCTSSVITNKAFVSLVLPSEHGGWIQERKDLKPPVCSSVNELEHYIDVSRIEMAKNTARSNKTNFMEVANAVIKQDSDYFIDLEKEHYVQLYACVAKILDDVTKYR